MKPPSTATQFRMARLQVYNWGTFSGLHEMPISARGFLIVGPSGAGKSTLLDAFSALLVPPRWVDFNAAAREADRKGRDRNLVSYIRGAWAAQSDSSSGVTTTRYLRGGATTWSAIALQYQNDSGQAVVLLQLFWLRGNSNAVNDVKRLFLVLERPFDLRALEDFGSSNFDVRKLKQAHPDAYVKDDFAPYCERFRRLLGIDHEMSLRLLHKTQSAKNVGDLNTFLRDFMLEKPETFEVAQRLVDEFGELNEAHQLVATARRQLETLTPARLRYQQMEQLRAERNSLRELEAGLHSYREQLRLRLLSAHHAQRQIDADGLSGRVQRLRGTLDNRELALRDLEQQRSAAGGERIEQLESERRLVDEQRVGRMAKRKQALAACTALDWSFSGAPEGFAALMGQARQELDAWQQQAAGADRLLTLGRARDDLQRQRDTLLQEIDSLRRQPSNIPAPMLEMRRRLALAIGVGAEALPFVGELLDVRPEEQAWRGAIERVLHGLALTLLVDDAHYAALSTHVNQASLGQKLVYLRTGGAAPSRQQAQALQPASLVAKLVIKPGHFAAWLQADLRQRFDYTCVESLKAFRAAAQRALTREGQIKHNHARHEKDDRSSVDDRRHWVLGFDNREKLALYEQQERQLGQQQQALERELEQLGKQRREAAVRVLQCQTLVNLTWQEIDAEPLVQRIGAIERLLATIRDSNANLQAIDQRLTQQRELVQAARRNLEQEQVALLSLQREIAELEQQLRTGQQDPSIVPLTPDQQAGLDQRYQLLAQSPTLKGVDSADRAVRKSLSDQVLDVSEAISDCVKYIEAQFSLFVSTWRADAEGLDAALASAGDFFTKLTRLETDGLPAHEQRFFDLLRNQSHQNLAALSTYLNDARKAILVRMELVNDSLREVPFNRSEERTTFLQIQPKDRQLAEVRQFKQDILDALSHAWHDDPQTAEARFLELRRLVGRLSSQDAELRRWRETVLDVRLHVEFIGREYDEHGVEQDVLESGAGKSGGQRQKLATTVLAAALRYQLGGSDNGLPVYAAVVLDEAFDKADSEFTALAMNIFTNFGFQMIVATPLKSVMTLEPFVGGACFVAIRDRRDSGLLLIDYDEDQRRLKLGAEVRAEVLLETTD